MTHLPYIVAAYGLTLGACVWLGVASVVRLAAARRALALLGARPGARRMKRGLTRKTRRLWLVLVCLGGFGTTTALVLNAFSSNIVFFMAPSQVRAHPPGAERTIRLGGMVVAGSVHRETEGTTPVARFDVTDGQDAIPVRYAGILPDLFREGQSVVAVGEMRADGSFRASEVLAKHDETYMPKEVADALRKSGKWDPRFGRAPDAASWNTMTRAQAAGGAQASAAQAPQAGG